MKRSKLLFMASLLITGMNVHAQTVDEIVTKNIEAMGGKDKVGSLKTVKMTGSTSSPGGDVAITMTKSQMTGVRIDFEVNGASNYQLANMKEGWVFMPAMGMSEPTKMEEEQVKAFASQSDIQGALFNYKEKGNVVTLEGSEKVDGNDAYKLKVVYKSGKTVNMFIDKKTNRLVKSAGRANVQGQDMDVQTTFSDYKQNADGYWFPYSVNNMGSSVTFDKIETNLPIDEKLFSK